MAIRKQGNVLILRESIPGESPIFATADPVEFEAKVQKLASEGCKTIMDLIDRAAARNPTAPAIIEDKADTFRTITYGEMVDWSKSLAKALLDGDYCPLTDVLGRKIRFLTIYMYNRPECALCDLAGYYMGALNNSIYEQPYEQCIYLLGKVDYDSMILQPNYAKQVIKLVREKTIHPVKHFIMTEELDPATTAEAKGLGISVERLADLVERGRKSKTVLPIVKPEDPSIIVTSNGLTGHAVAEVLTHRSILNQSLSSYVPNMSPEDSTIMNLNSAFISAKVLTLLFLTYGGKIYFRTFSGPVLYDADNPESTIDFMRKARPSFVYFPPVYLHKMHDVALEKMKKMPADKSAELMKAIQDKISLMKSSGSLVQSEQDKLLAPIREMLFGPRLRIALYGGAKLRDDTLWFFRAVLGCPLMSGYGMTEVGGLCCLSEPLSEFGGVGKPIAGCELKIVDSDEKGYSVKDVVNGKPAPRGELYIRSKSNFDYHLKNPELTTESFTADGWLRTRDAVQLNPEDMSMTILGRVNNVTKLTNVEYVCLEVVEAYYHDSQYVRQICVYANYDREYIVAIIVPKEDKVIAWAKSKGLKEDFAELCKNPELIQTIGQDIKSLAEKKQLSHHEHILVFSLTPEPFTKENGMLASTGKLKRTVIYAKYADTINSLYKSK